MNDVKNAEQIFEYPRLYQFLKFFISTTIIEINNEYNMSFIKFVFNEDDLNFISSKLDMDNDRIKIGINILKRNIREYTNNRDEDITYIKIDNTYRFFYLLSKIYNSFSIIQNTAARDLLRSIWLRMNVDDINHVNAFLDKQLQFMYGNSLFDEKYQTFEYYDKYKLVYEDKKNEDCFETNRHLEISYINKDHSGNKKEKEKYSLPVVHYAISYENGNPVCDIYGIQTLKEQRKDDSVIDTVKQDKKPLRNGNVSPEFVLALKKFIDIIESYGVTDIRVPLIQVFNYQYHEYLSKAIERDYMDYSDEEKAKYDEMLENDDLTSSVLCYLHTKNSYVRFVDKEDIISKNKTERLIDTFMIMEEKYHNIAFLNEPFIEGDTLLIKINKESDKSLRKTI